MDCIWIAVISFIAGVVVMGLYRKQIVAKVDQTVNKIKQQ